MCGIAAIIHPEPAVALAGVRMMNASQSHRGPDGEGVRVLNVGGRTVVFGHRRLAIQDLSAAGRQPMENPATGDIIVYNGELYNVGELRSELANAGAVFRSRSDTEVLLAAFERWGMACVDRLHGMFGFALWSARERIVYLARDPLGIKPVYWATLNGGILIVASEVRSMLTSGLIERSVDRVAMESLLAYGAVAHPRTMVRGVYSLDPGTWSAIDPLSSEVTLRLRTTRYWSFGMTPRVDVSRQPAVEALRPVLSESVRSHLVSDVPVAVFLSGGIDSTLVAALAREAREVDTFTVCLEEDLDIDEAPIAKRTAAALGTCHHEVILGERDALELATQWLSSLDQPSVDGLNTYVISRAARQRGIVVALSGLGGDEMFGGYSTFRQIPLLLSAIRLARRMPFDAAARVAAMWRLGSETRAAKLRDLLDIDPTAVSLALWRRRLMSNAQMTALGLGGRASEAFLPPEFNPSEGAPEGSTWAAVRAVEARFYMSNMLLRDADVFGMANGLEIRVPLLDRRVVDVALAHARSSLDFRRWPNKPWLVGAADGRISGEVLKRTKSGFSLPQSRWMKGPLRDMFEDRVETVSTSGLVDGRGAREIWRGFLREAAGPAWSRAWLLGALGEWLSKGEPAPEGARRRSYEVTTTQ